MAGNYSIEGGGSYDVALKGNIAFLADGALGLQAIDVSNPANPAKVGNYRTPQRATSVNVRGNAAYVSNEAGGLEILDVTDPAQMTRAAVWGQGANVGVHLEGDRGFFIRPTGVDIVSVANPLSPALIATYPITNPRGVDQEGDRLYIALGLDGIEVVDIRNPARPIRIDRIATRAFSVLAFGDIVYAQDGNAWRIRNMNPMFPASIGIFRFASSINDVTRAGDRLIVETALGDGSLIGRIHSVDITVPAAPRLLDSIATPILTRGASVAEGNIFVAQAGLKIYRAGALARPELHVRIDATPVLSLRGLIGSRYLVETAANLSGAEWAPLQAITLTTTPQPLPVPAGDAAFVRARVAP